MEEGVASGFMAHLARPGTAEPRSPSEPPGKGTSHWPPPRSPRARPVAGAPSTGPRRVGGLEQNLALFRAQLGLPPGVRVPPIRQRPRVFPLVPGQHQVNPRDAARELPGNPLGLASFRRMMDRQPAEGLPWPPGPCGGAPGPPWVWGGGLQGAWVKGTTKRVVAPYGPLSHSSAICTAFRAAPFRSWSPTTKKSRPWSKARLLRIRPTSTSHLPLAVRGMG